MALVSLPNSLADGTPAHGPEVRANDDAIVAQVNGNLDAANVKPTANLPGTVISNVAGSRVPSDRIEDDAIDATKLKDDAAVDANRAVTTNHIRDSAVTTAKIAALAVASGKLKLATVSWVPGGVLVSGTNSWNDTGLTNASGIILRSHLEFAGVPAGSEAEKITVLEHYRDSATGHWWVGIRNHAGTNSNLAGITVITTYVQA